MNIKEKIGERILAERKARGLSRRALADLTYDLKPSSINNWERAERAPGADGVKQLAEALDVSIAYLMCLTDDKDSDKPKPVPGLGALVPLLTHQQTFSYKQTLQRMKEEQNPDQIEFIPLNTNLAVGLGEYAFALQMKDDSMHPEIRVNDILIIDPEKRPVPGGFVLAIPPKHVEPIIRRYRQLTTSMDNQEFELIAINENWGNILSTPHTKNNILGVVVGIIRKLVG